MEFPFSGIVVRYRRPKVNALSECSCATTEVGETQTAVDYASTNGSAFCNHCRSNMNNSPDDISELADEPRSCENDTKAVNDKQGVRADDYYSRIGVDLHVNLWDIGDKQYLDIGIMIPNSHVVDEVMIDLPWVVEKENVVDLGAGMDGDKILTAIFNDIASYQGIANQNYAVVTIGSAQPDFKNTFAVARVDLQSLTSSAIALGESTKAGRLRFKWPELSDCSVERKNSRLRRYVRLRVTHAKMDAFFTTFKPKDRNLLSSSATTRLLDFRVNVRRGVPDQLLNGDPLVEFPVLRKVHVFAILRRETELAFYGEDYKGCRSLEDEQIWNSYINLPLRNGLSPETVRDYLGYQWTTKDVPAKDLVALGRFIHVSSSLWTNMRFMLIVMLLGTLGAALWDWTKPVFGAGQFVNNMIGDAAVEIYIRTALPLCLLGVLFFVSWSAIESLIGNCKAVLYWFLRSLRGWWRRL